ncbi:MAG TPA: GtrA family protein [Candidatus Paceibacterota bacterium]|nr:GtrA family protein [Candidatus Paceibacterota bacterium]
MPAITRRSALRLFRYSLVGGSTFAFDLLLIAAMTELVGIPYYVATPIGFLVAVSVNYALSRRFVFIGSERKMHHGYAYFIGLACVAALGITGAVALLVGAFALHYLAARTLVAGVVGFGNYLLNLHFNFKVAGIH